MRIVGGSLSGRTLRGPRSDAIRPTSDRLREALFNVLRHAYGDPVDDARVLDLFAGTGAFSFEALSHGAAYALLVDEGAEARGLIRENIEALGLEGVTRLYRRDATKLGLAQAIGRFSLVFCDPPYGRGLAPKALAAAVEGGWLEPDALVLVEESASSPLGPLPGFSELERRDYGETAVTFLRFEGA
ncbi:16S rRNA (guanine(966)-N(2))-methyltransferase RsmD [Methylobacterium brachythecii]|uniref:16S rRNA (Guanine966-N2)-methyltransferase n=1 Tax=Methylobacterium brachythecii TaxID=1176177 RepID=A0A7W6F7F2_9HYPH|nr:16S rRNA (guanine(966)-N(2))-methyltransferase RsmD [Methylobacterium brachythecii]MBB3903320.1 16S rRNA (guanine966-N2)-methyltransferase [Methylobacterium brachythecii]GLS46829.1 DNA methyltransferase [Methylobacterium brachythecii]